MRKKTSIVIDENLWNKFRIYSVKMKMDSSEILEELMRREMRK